MSHALTPVPLLVQVVASAFLSIFYSEAGFSDIISETLDAERGMSIAVLRRVLGLLGKVFMALVTFFAPFRAC